MMIKASQKTLSTMYQLLVKYWKPWTPELLQYPSKTPLKVWCFRAIASRTRETNFLIPSRPNRLFGQNSTEGHNFGS